MSPRITSKAARIFRITHRDNIPWILENGLHCQNSSKVDPNFVNIGNPDLIARRSMRPVPIPPGGTLSDYLPFYFTPHSPMMYNIHTGRSVTRRSNNEIVIIASSLPALQEAEKTFVFTDRHAYLMAANFYGSLENIDEIAWNLLKNRDFRRDPNDPSAIERYQAEALVHGYLEPDLIEEFVCYDRNVEDSLRETASSLDVDVDIKARATWYF